jgi:hypothetical protein
MGCEWIKVGAAVLSVSQAAHAIGKLFMTGPYDKVGTGSSTISPYEVPSHRLIKQDSVISPL